MPRGPSIQWLVLVSTLCIWVIEIVIGRVAHTRISLLAGFAKLIPIVELTYFSMRVLFPLALSFVFEWTDLAPVNELHVVEIRLIAMHGVIQLLVLK